jgi:hypothetical protein
MRRGFTLAGIVAAALSVSIQAGPRPAPASITRVPDRAVLDRYCVTCHNDKLKASGLSLESLDIADVAGHPAVWERVLGKLRTGSMPPPGRPRPSDTDAAPIVNWLETSLDQLAKDNPNPGRPIVHRINRTEYGNAVRDILSLDVNVSSLLPPDDSGGGFDNIADVLSVSPLLLERYLVAAQKVSRLAIGDQSLHDDVYRVPRILVQDERTNEDLPLGTRGGTAIRHYFPIDGDYLIKVRLARNTVDEAQGLLHHYSVDVLIDGVRTKSFSIGGDEFEKGHDAYVDIDEAIASLAAYLTHADDGLELRVPVKAGTHLVAVTFPMQSDDIEGTPEKRIEPKSWDGYQGKLGLAGIGKVEIRGPLAVAGLGTTPSRRRIFSCHPTAPAQETPCARRILATIARNAFRRPVSEADIKTLLDFYQEGRKSGGFETGIEFGLERILVSPFFVFRAEQDPPRIAPNTPFRVSDLELASRLSFFLWSSVPDNQLLDVAARGQLRNPAVLDREVKRMLTDPKSRALVTNFAAQWLGLNNLAFAVPNDDLFPQFDENLRQAFKTETEMFVDSILREDHSALDLLTANYTYVNERLARHYDIPNVHGNWFRRVTLPKDQAARGGILGQGSVLTVTSLATRTSPVSRGKWVLENILGTPPPPPPPNVPALTEKSAAGKPLSMREAMETHRKNPVCAACHSRMDPLGLALENFNAIGEWRMKSESDEPIDASGELSNGMKFNGPVDLRQVLLTKKEQFVETITEKLLMYATGRGMEYYDFPTVREIVQNAAAHDYRMSSLVLGVIKSAPFQMRRSMERSADTVATAAHQ